jgi:hypothetical protein
MPRDACVLLLYHVVHAPARLNTLDPRTHASRDSDWSARVRGLTFYFFSAHNIFRSTKEGAEGPAHRMTKSRPGVLLRPPLLVRQRQRQHCEGRGTEHPASPNKGISLLPFLSRVAMFGLRARAAAQLQRPTPSPSSASSASFSLARLGCASPLAALAPLASAPPSPSARETQPTSLSARWPAAPMRPWGTRGHPRPTTRGE